MRSDAKTSQAILGLARAIEATFSKGDWLALGLATDADDAIRGHKRLLRSLEWGDDDYLGNVMEVLPAILGARRGASLKGRAVDRLPNLTLVERQVGLQAWLAANDRALHDELYSGEDIAVLDDLRDAAEQLGIPDIDMHAVRIRRGLHDDPAQAIGSAKELLETTLKAVLDLHGTGRETKLEIPTLIKRANLKLGLDAASTPNEPGAVQRRKVLGSLAQIVNAAAELRNAGLGTGHGVSQGPTPRRRDRAHGCLRGGHRRNVLRRGTRRFAAVFGFAARFGQAAVLIAADAHPAAEIALRSVRLRRFRGLFVSQRLRQYRERGFDQAGVIGTSHPEERSSQVAGRGQVPLFGHRSLRLRALCEAPSQDDAARVAVGRHAPTAACRVCSLAPLSRVPD